MAGLAEPWQWENSARTWWSSVDSGIRWTGGVDCPDGSYQAKGLIKRLRNRWSGSGCPLCSSGLSSAEVLFVSAGDDGQGQSEFESYYDGENLFQHSWRIFTNARTEIEILKLPDTKLAGCRDHQPEYKLWNAYRELLLLWNTWDFPWVSVAGYHLHFISEMTWPFGGHAGLLVVKEGMIEVGAKADLLDQCPVQDRQYLFAKFNVDEMRKILISQNSGLLLYHDRFWVLILKGGLG